MRAPINDLGLLGGSYTAKEEKAQPQTQTENICSPWTSQPVLWGRLVWTEPKPDDYNADYLVVALGEDGEVFFHPGLLGFWGPIVAAADATFLYLPEEPMLVSSIWARETFPSQTGWILEFSAHVRRKILREKNQEDAI